MSSSTQSEVPSQNAFTGVVTPPLIAAGFCLIGIPALFRLDWNRARTSTALWLPVTWLVLSCSRPISEWTAGTTEVAGTLDRIAEGNPLERNVYTVLLVLGIIALIGRGTRLSTYLKANVPVLVFFSYCALSIMWSDYPDVAFKRYIKAIGDLVMIWLVITDRDHTLALKRLLARVSFLLVPISVLLIKYYPNIGRAYNNGSGTFSAVGVTNDKNMLGVICLVCGLGSVWQILQALPGRIRLRNGPLIAHGLILLMVIWLFKQANSATSAACFAMSATLMIVSAATSLGHRRRKLVFVMMLAFGAVSFSALFLNVGGGMLESMGRDSSLTGRTDLWKELASMNPNVFLGSGFESFWLGRRLAHLWTVFQWKPNEAHNGYLEVYLNLGAVGVTLLGILIVTGYFNAMRTLRYESAAGVIRLGFFFMPLVYCFTEAGFRELSPIWLAFLVAIMAVPRSVSRSKRKTRTIVRTQVGESEPLSIPETVPSDLRWPAC